ncbi:MAG: MBL fold metallo-hydrolase, partial [Acidobacteriota bacterium]|nr:MBL fold metallo-hydrolase [Acidobacteriota bacterium]
ANVMHMGDLLFNRAHPNIDRPQGASVANWIKVLEAVNNRASNDTIFIAGHAKDNVVRNTKAEVMHFRNYLTAVLEHARAGAKAGQSKEEVQKLPVLKGFEDNVSPNARLTLAFVLGICYDEVTGK